MAQIQKKIKWFRMRVTEAEAQAIDELSRQAGCRTISDYCRREMLKTPRFVRHRNKSAIDFQTEMLKCKRMLNDITANIAQAGELLSRPSQTPDIRVWGKLNGEEAIQFKKKIDKIFETTDKIYKLWSHD